MATRPEPTPDEIARIDAARTRLIEHKADARLSWSTIGDAVGRPGGTLSAFGGGKYEGLNLQIAEEIERYFAGLAAQAEIRAAAPRVPDFVHTPFAAEMIAQLKFAQSGEIVAIAGAPGLGKTITARHYRGLVANVWLATMKRSSARLQPMQIDVLKAMGDAAPKGSPQQLSAQIVAKMTNSGGLLIIDEFHELSDDAIEELRSWHDATGVGIALVGDYRVIATIEGRKDRRDRAQIFSRVSQRMVRHHAGAGDASPLLDAWGIEDPAARKYATAIAGQPGALRSMTKMLKLAAFAADDGVAVTLADLRAARARLTSTLDA